MLSFDSETYTDDDVPQTAAETFAGSVADVQGGRRFVGGLFREDAHDPEGADDADLEWLHGYTEDDPGSLSDVLNTFGPGLYRIRTAVGFPAAIGRRITVQVGRRKAAPQVVPAHGPNATPEVPPANIERLRREAVEAARADIEYEKDGLAREVRRLKLEAADAEETLARARREVDRLAAEANTLRQDLASAQNEAIKARRELADESMRHATDAATAARDTADEIDGYRAELAELRAEMTVRDYELAAARRGESVDSKRSDAMWDKVISAGLPFVERVAAGLAARTEQAEDDFEDFDSRREPAAATPAAPSPNPLPAMPAPAAMPAGFGDGPAAFPPVVSVPELSGDGAAGGILLGSVFASAPAVVSAEPSTAADVSVLGVQPDSFAAVAQVARAVLTGSTPNVPPADVLALIEQAQATGVTPDDWRELASLLVAEAATTGAAVEWRSFAAQLVAEAVDARPDVSTLADVVAPFAAPFAEKLRMILKAPAAVAVPLVFDNLGLSVPAGATKYLGSFLRALRDRL